MRKEIWYAQYMLRKFSTIKNLASFKDYSWDSVMAGQDAKYSDFSDINIIFGQNGTGKTSLSRILRSWEMRQPIPHHEAATYCVEDVQESTVKTITENDFLSCGGKYRVFNADFISENLNFSPSDSDASGIGATAFAVIGKNNVDNEKLINEKESELRDETGGGLLDKLEKLEDKLKDANVKKSKCDKTINGIISSIATDRTKGIKYDRLIRPDKNGENYDVRALGRDMREMEASGFSPITPEEQEALFDELKSPVMEIIHIDYLDVEPLACLWDSVNNVVRRELQSTGKIRELLEDNILSNWVQNGMKIHETQHSVCQFCGGVISDERWHKLQLHFNNELESILSSVLSVTADVEEAFSIYEKTPTYFNLTVYPQFQQRWKDAVDAQKVYRELCVQKLEDMRDALSMKQVNVYKVQNLEWNYDDVAREISAYNALLQELVDEINKYTIKIEENKEQTRTKLRYNKIYNYLETSQYTIHLDEQKRLSDDICALNEERQLLENKISDIKGDIKRLTDDMSSESEGAQRVNEYLTKFGQSILRLSPAQTEDGKACTKFHILRDGTTAYNLSEGESRLIAFCYFLAKLDNIKKTDEQPIIWIDDPICSMDSTHVYNTYAVIRAHIIDERRFSQLFITTHSLEFLRYLVRISGKKISPCKQKPDGENYKKHFYVVDKNYGESSLRVMPLYLQNMVTQFNYLFEKIFSVANDESFPSDAELEVYSSIRNNMRRFLELYTSFHFPDGSFGDQNLIAKLNKIMGPGNNEKVYSILRVCHEGSHFEKGYDASLDPILPGTIKRTAQEILKAIEKHNKPQYDSLVAALRL